MGLTSSLEYIYGSLSTVLSSCNDVLCSGSEPRAERLSQLPSMISQKIDGSGSGIIFPYAYANTNISKYNGNEICVLNSAFLSCYYLSLISCIKCEYIGISTFYSCRLLSSISFPECNYIDTSAFCNCSSLTTISFPKCTLVSAYGFAYCSRLTTVLFQQCSSVGVCTFKGCSQLTSISFPLCKYIGASAFESCRSLTTISFPECIRINGSAFKDCTSLTTGFFPQCEYISGFAFSNCTNLTSVYLLNPSKVVTIGMTPFYPTFSNLTIYVPSNLYSQYVSDRSWSIYSTRISVYTG